MERKALPVTGMPCTGCEQNVENALETMDGVTRVDADHSGDTAEVVDDAVEDADLHAAVERAGYDVSDT
jgi:copper chaperone